MLCKTVFVSISVEMLPVVPIGTIISWVFKVDNTTGKIVELPEGWMRCNGEVIPEGPWTGRRVPDLNGDRRFLRGGSDDEMLTLEDDQILQHTHNIQDNGHTHPYVDTYFNDYEDGKGPIRGDIDYDSFTQQHSKNTGTAKTGITVEGVSDEYIHGDENRPKNMGIIWIIRVW